MEGYSQENLLGLPRDDQGGVHQLRVEVIDGTDQEPRINAPSSLCKLLHALPNGVTAFNNFMLPQHIIASQIVEETPE